MVYERDDGVLDDREEGHREAAEQIDVDALHVGDLGQRGVRAPYERDHGQDGRDAESDACRRRIAVQPEGHEREDDDKCRGYVDLQDEVAQAAHKVQLESEARVETLYVRRIAIKTTFLLNKNHHI